MKKLMSADLFIPSELASFLVSVIEDAVGDNIKEDILSNGLIDPNSAPSRIWDYINRDMVVLAGKHNCLCNITRRGPWTMVVLYDPASHYVITIMREKRFEELRRGKKNRKGAHYLDAFATCLNGDLLAPGKQQSFFDDEDDTDEVLDEAAIIVRKMTAAFSSGGRIDHHVLVLFSSEGYQLTSVRAVMVDSDLDIVCSENWSDNISARESVVADIVAPDNEAFANPNRGLELTAKATQRQSSRAKIKQKSNESTESST